MKSDQTNKILEEYQESGELTPQVAEELASLTGDPQARQWLDGKHGFDRQMAAAVAGIPVPRALQSMILAQPKIFQLVPWWRRPVALAAAAGFLLFAGSAGLWSSRGAKTFAEYRQTVIDEAWGRAPHLDFETSDIGQFNKWLAATDPNATVTLPSGLNDLTLRGGRTMQWHGHTVVLLCFLQGPKHMHLFVMNDRTFPDLSAQAMPDFEKCNGWKTVSWSQGTRSYVLTGMNYLTFLKKFRHSRQWTMDG
jgi:hypothetical protein